METEWRTTYVTVPCDWDTATLLEYVEHRLRSSGRVTDRMTVRLQLVDSEVNENHTTTWRSRYSTEECPAPPRRRPLSMTADVPPG